MSVLECAHSQALKYSEFILKQDLRMTLSLITFQTVKQKAIKVNAFKD